MKLLNYLKYLLTKIRLLLLGDFNFEINKNNDPMQNLRSFKPKLKPTEFCFSKIKDTDRSSFKKDIIESDIMQNTTYDLGGLVKQYNDTLSNIWDKHAPLKTCKLRMTGSQPWYDKNVFSVFVPTLEDTKES